MFYTILEWILKIALAVFGIGFCIFSHELGHFLAAKLLGLHVDAFSIGFRAFWKKKYRGVEYRLGWIPIGGYCEIPQIDATDETPKAADGTELRRAKPHEKIITAAAGPLFNIISGALVACVIWAFGMPQDTPKMRSITVQEIDKTGPEYAAGLREGDKIVKLNGNPFLCTWARFLEKLIYVNGEVELTVERGDKTLVIRYFQKINPNNERLTKEGLPAPFFSPRIPIDLVPKSGGVAEKAGLKSGDRIIKIDGRIVGTDTPDQIALRELQSMMMFSQGKPLHFTLLRNGKTFEIDIAPHQDPHYTVSGGRYLIGVLFLGNESSENNLKIGGVNVGSPAEKAGIKPGDLIIELDGKTVKDNKEFRETIGKCNGKPVTLKLKRAEKLIDIELAPVKVIPIPFIMTIDTDFPMDYPSPWKQFVSTLNSSYRALSGFGITIGKKLGLTKKESSIKPRHVSGVVGMGTVLTQNVHFKMSYREFSVWIYLIVMISFALAIFNLLPLPVLDGGHILFGCIELVIRRPLPVKVVKVLYITFAVLLILLMIYATFNDVRRIYESSRKEEPAKAKAEPETKPAKPETKPAK